MSTTLTSKSVKMTDQQINEVVLAATKALLEGKELSDVLEFLYNSKRGYLPCNHVNLDQILRDVKIGTIYRIKPNTTVICGVEFTEDELPQKSVELRRKYFLLNSCDEGISQTWYNDVSDLTLVEKYNVFLTKEAAEKFAKVKNKLIEKALNGEFA